MQIQIPPPHSYFTLGATASGTVTISTPLVFHTYQRNITTGLGSIPITGTYTGSPTAIQANFNGGGWFTIAASPGGGTYSGSLTGQTAGQGTLQVRFANDTSVTASVATIGIGDIYVCIGDSICKGSLSNNQSTVANGNGITATCWESGAWKLANDPTISGGGGSFWPLVGTQLVAVTLTYPVGFINLGTGSTGLYFPSTGTGVWVKGQSAYDNIAVEVTSAVIGEQPKGFLIHLGANDAADPTTTPTLSVYSTLAAALVTNLRNDFSGCTVFWAQLGGLTSGTPPDRRSAIDNVRETIRVIWNTASGAWNGPVMYDINTDDGVHVTTNAKGLIVATRWALAIIEKFYGGTLGTGRGPTATSKTINGAKDRITLTFYVPTQPILPATDPAGWRVLDSGVLSGATVTATRLSNTQIRLSLSSAIVGTPTLSLGSNNDVADNGGAVLTEPTDSSTNLLPAEAFIASVLATETTTMTPGSFGQPMNASHWDVVMA